MTASHPTGPPARRGQTQPRSAASTPAWKRLSASRRLISSDTVRRTVRSESPGSCEADGSPDEPQIRVVSRTPAYQGDPALTAQVLAAHERAFGAERVAWWPPSLASEDFPLLVADGIPSSYWMLGTVGPRQWRAAAGASAAEKLGNLPTNHSSAFAPSVGLALPAGVAALVVAALTARPGSGPRRCPDRRDRRTVGFSFLTPSRATLGGKLGGQR